LNEELNGIVAWFVKGQAAGTTETAAFSVAIEHANRTI
jgi:hypothetical protein